MRSTIYPRPPPGAGPTVFPYSATSATPSSPGTGRAHTILESGLDGVVAVHSLSKRSNLAGLRIGFYAGDAELVSYLQEVRKHVGMLVPGPVQAAATVALGDDDHVARAARSLPDAAWIAWPRHCPRLVGYRRWECPLEASICGLMLGMDGSTRRSWRTRAGASGEPGRFLRSRRCQ